MDNSLRRIHNDDRSISKQTRIDYNTLMTGTGISFVLVATAWKGIKFLWSLARKGTAGALKFLESKNPFPALTILSMGVECVGLMASIPAISDDLPGANLRRWNVTLSTPGVGTNAIFMLLGWDADDLGEKSLLVSWHWQTSASIELSVSSNSMRWAGKAKNNESTAVGSVTCIFSTLASVGYFMAFFYRTSAPQASGVGLGFERLGA
ncbi:MAG: hypothetical protein Q9205_005314 [Flavoplaca limonia]